MSRNAKYNRWKKSHPKTLPEGFTAATVLLSDKEAEFLRGRAALLSDGTFSAAIRDRMGLMETPRGLMKAVEDMLDGSEQ